MGSVFALVTKACYLLLFHMFIKSYMPSSQHVFMGHTLKGSLVQALAVALCCVLEQDTLSSA